MWNKVKKAEMKKQEEILQNAAVTSDPLFVAAKDIYTAYLIKGESANAKTALRLAKQFLEEYNNVV